MSKYDKASLVMIPSGYKADKLYSVLPVNGNGDFDHDRNSVATRVNKDGLIESVAADVPRLDYPLIDGVVQGCPALLLESARTNLVTYSQDFSNAVWNKSNSSIVSNQITSPDGTLNADKLVANTSAAILSATFISSGNTDVTVSFFVKADTLSHFSITEAFYFGTITNFDLSLGSSDNGKIQYYGNGWYRCSKTYTYASGQQIVAIQIKTGATGSLYIFGGQYEQNSVASSYIPTSGSTVTRSADVCDGAGTSAEFNDSEGVLYAEMRALSSSDTSSRRLGITKNGTYEGLRLQLGNGNISATLYDGTSNVYNTIVNFNNSIFNKAALKYKENDFAFWINGFKYDSQSSGSTFTEGTLNDISFDYVGGNDFYGKTKELAVFKEALTDSELEDLTSWDSFNDMAKGQLYTIE
jgi:hypothetical protein